jgi:hypothetical protein
MTPVNNANNTGDLYLPLTLLFPAVHTVAYFPVG